MNIWVAPTDRLDAARALTASRDRPIRSAFWSPDSTMTLFIQDKAGDEKFLLYGVDVETGIERALTPFNNTRVRIVGVSPLIKDRILVGLNNRDPQWHDLHSLDLKTGALNEIMRGDGYEGFLSDAQLAVRLALRPNAAGGTDYLPVTDGAVAETPIAVVGLDDSLTTNPAGFTADGKTLYWIDSRGGGLIGVVNRQLGLAAYSPRLDAKGNTVRGVAAFELLAEEMGLHAFCCTKLGSSLVERFLR